MALATTCSTIPVTAIDLSDRAFVVTFGRAWDGLASSIQGVGLINPPVLAAQPGKPTCRIVCGFLRMQALRQLGLAEVQARVIQPGATDAEMLALALHDNLAQRAFNPVEQAGAIARLLRYMPENEVVGRWLPLLGLPPAMKALDTCLRIDGLEHELKEALAAGLLSGHSAAELAALPVDDRQALYKLFSSVHLSVSKQAEVIDSCGDLARRDAVTICCILQSEGIREILEAPNPNLSQKGEQVRSWLRSCRFPRLSRREERFTALAKKLPHAGGVRLVPPPSFEGGTYRIEIAFSRQEVLAAAARTVQALAEDERLRQVLEDGQ
jgi:ParB-like chromosome segregation protein Spo0J